VVTNELYEDLPNEGWKVLLGKCWWFSRFTRWKFDYAGQSGLLRWWYFVRDVAIKRCDTRAIVSVVVI